MIERFGSNWLLFRHFLIFFDLVHNPGEIYLRAASCIAIF